MPHGTSGLPGGRGPCCEQSGPLHGPGNTGTESPATRPLLAWALGETGPASAARRQASRGQRCRLPPLRRAVGDQLVTECPPPPPRLPVLPRPEGLSHEPGLRRACLACLTDGDARVFPRIQEIKWGGGGGQVPAATSHPVSLPPPGDLIRVNYARGAQAKNKK